MRAEQITGASRRASRWTTSVLCALAFVAVANLVISGARTAATGAPADWPMHLAVGIAAAVLLALLAYRRLDSDGAPEITLGPPDAGAPSSKTGRRRWLRRARWLVGPAVIVVALVSISGQWDTVTDGVGRLAHLDWRYVRLAVYVEALSTVAFATLWWILLRGRGARLALRSLIALTVASSALSVSLPAGQAVAATFSFDQLRRRGVSRGTAGHVLISGIASVAVALTLLLALGVEIAGGRGPAAPFRLVVEVVVASVLVLSALLIITRRLGWPSVAPRPRVLIAAVAAALGNWTSDCACFVAAILAVGGHVPWSAVLLVYAVGQVAAALPISPGGVGVVEGALSVLLVAYGMHAPTAVAAVLLYRIVSFWLQVPIGLATAAAMQFGRRRRLLGGRVEASTEVAPLPASS